MNDDMMPIQKLDILRASCCVAGSDGKVDETEVDVLRRMAQDVGVGKASLAAMIARAESDPEFHEEQFRILKYEPTSTMATLLEVAVANNQISDQEIEVLKILAGRINIEPGIFQDLISRVRAQLDQS